VKRDYALGNKTFATEAAYGSLMEMTKNASKSFNYTRRDKLSSYDNVILDLHDESNTLEKLDKTFDVRDGYKI
jgi:tRNA A58 N-methylase Trm61